MEAVQSFTGNPFHLVFHLCIPVQIVFVVLDSLTLLACHTYLFVYTSHVRVWDRDYTVRYVASPAYNICSLIQQKRPSHVMLSHLVSPAIDGGLRFFTPLTLASSKQHC